MAFDKISRALHIFGAKVYDHRADIEFGGGVICDVGSTILLVKAAIDVAEDIKHYANLKKHMKDDGILTDLEQKNILKDTGKDVAVKVIKKSAPGVVLKAAEIVLYGLSHKTLTDENDRLNLVATSAVASYELLKKRIAETDGADHLRDLLNGDTKVKETVNEETGEVTQTKENDGEGVAGQYAYFFGPDYTNPEYDEEHPVYTTGSFETAPGANFVFISSVQQHFQFKAQHEGHWLLKDALKELGYPKSVYMDERIAKAGNVYRNKDGSYNEVSFGLDDESVAMKEFKEGLNDTALLVFNVVPNVYKLL